MENKPEIILQDDADYSQISIFPARPARPPEVATRRYHDRFVIRTIWQSRHDICGSCRHNRIRKNTESDPGRRKRYLFEGGSIMWTQYGWLIWVIFGGLPIATKDIGRSWT